MNVVKKILFTLVLVAGLSVASMAQKGGDGKGNRPPKGNPPVINPGQKPPPQNPPKGGGDKPKKPGMAFIIKREEILADLA
jgi:hypothetical protein